MSTTGFSDSDLSRKAKGHQNGTQSRTVGMFMAESDLDEVAEHPHLGFGSNPKGTRVHRCVQKTKGRRGVNPYAVCQASTGQSYATGKSL